MCSRKGWRHTLKLLLCFLPFCPARLHRRRDTLPSRGRHSAALGRAWWSAPAFTRTADSLQTLDRSVKPAALLFELLDELVHVHVGILTLGTSEHGLPSPPRWRTAQAFTCHVRSGRRPSIEHAIANLRVPAPADDLGLAIITRSPHQAPAGSCLLYT